jgi:hypothetical protein
MNEHELRARLGQLLDQIDVLVDEVGDLANESGPAVAKSLKVAMKLAADLRLQVKMTAMAEDE